MGGPGSGNRHRWDAKDTTAGVRRLDVRALRRAGRLAPGGAYGWHWTDGGMITIRVGATAVEGRALSLTLRYRSRRGQGAWEDVAEVVTLTWTPCRYGGWRPWFRCPVAATGIRCGRRVAILYGAGTYFACRHCYRLAYPSTRQDAADRNAARLIALRERLGGPGGLAQPWPTKPRGMHWRTYWRLTREGLRLDRAHTTHFEARIARLDALLRRRYAEMGLPWEDYERCVRR